MTTEEQSTNSADGEGVKDTETNVDSAMEQDTNNSSELDGFKATMSAM